MLDTDFSDFQTIWKYLAEIYGKQLPSDTAQKIIFQALRTFTIEQIRRAASYYIRTGKFMPRPADIGEIIFGTVEDRARAAFLEAVDAVEKIGFWPSVKFTDDAIMLVIYALGGWPEFCHLVKSNRSHIESRFIKWHGAAQSMNEKNFPPVLKGADNLAKDYREVVCNVNVSNLRALSA